jgi:hypothetical protein
MSHSSLQLARLELLPRGGLRFPPPLGLCFCRLQAPMRAVQVPLELLHLAALPSTCTIVTRRSVLTKGIHCFGL